MKDKIGIGFLGTGFAQKTQMPAFAECEGASLVSVASRSLENARAAAAGFSISHFTDDWRETVERDDVDLVCITTPPVLHHEMALHSLKNGKHVLCEKPMAMNAAESREMTEAAESAGLMALIDHELRFLNGRRKGYEILRSREIGKVLHAKSAFRNASRGVAERQWDWWSDESQGGGVLGAIGSHAIDGFHWLLGARIKEVSCLLKTNVKERRGADGNKREVTSDDECSLIFRFEDSDLTRDATGTGCFSMVEIGKPDFQTEFYGTEGSLIIGEAGRLNIAKKGENEFKPVDVEIGEPARGMPTGGWSIGFLSFAKAIIEALREGRTEIEGAATFRNGHDIQKVLDAARKADATGSRTAV